MCWDVTVDMRENNQDLQLLQVRNDISNCGDYIHMDNINSSPIPKIVYQKMKNALDIEHLMGYCELEQHHSRICENIRNLLGKLINSSNPQQEIAIIESGVGAWSYIFSCITIRPSDIVLVTKVESGSNYLNVLHNCRRVGADIMYIPSDSNGSISLIALKSILESLPTIRIVCLTWIPSSGAHFSEIYECGNIIACYPNIIFIIDANQAIGQQVVDVTQLRCHLLTGSSNHYLRSPHGIDFLYVSPNVFTLLQEPYHINLSSGKLNDLHSYELCHDARRFEIIPTNYNILIGFEASLEYYFSLVSSNSPKESNWCLSRFNLLGNLLVNSFNELQLLSQEKDSHCRELIIWNSSISSGILCFTINGVSCQRIKEIFRSRNVFVSICKHPESSYVDAVERRLPDRIRISIHYFNTEIEIFIVCDLMLKELLYEE